MTNLETTLTRVILTDPITGKELVNAWGVSLWHRWEWIKEFITDRFGCEPCDIDTIETEDGDFITVDGEIVAKSNW